MDEKNKDMERYTEEEKERLSPHKEII